MGACGWAGRWVSGQTGRHSLVQAALCQRVAHVLITCRQQLFLLVRTGQRVAAVVGAHVEGSIHRVGEVCGLQVGMKRQTVRLVHSDSYLHRSTVRRTGKLEIISSAPSDINATFD